MEKYFEKDGRKFVVHFDESQREVFIGTIGVLSNIAAQMICHEVMEPLKWKTTKTFMDLNCNGYRCTAVGYKVPLGIDGEVAIEDLFSKF